MIKLRLAVLYVTLLLLLSACNISVTSFPSAPQQPPVQLTELPPTPYPDTPAPEMIDASIIESPAFIDIQFLNELDGWAVTETQIVRTNDGGIT